MFCQRKGHGLLRRPSRVRSSMGFYQGGLKAQPFDLFAMRNEPGEVTSLIPISFFLNQCKGHNQDASKTTPSYIALMPFQAPSRLLRELIQLQLAAREPQTSPAELIHTRSKERERILSKGRGSGREKRESPFLCHDPHSARHTDFISQRASTQALPWSVPKNLVGLLLQLQLKSSKRNARCVCQVEVGKSAVRPSASGGLPATAVATATSFSRVSRR